MKKYIENFITEEERKEMHNWVINQKPVAPQEIPDAVRCIHDDNINEDGSVNGLTWAFCFCDTEIGLATFEYNGKDVEINSVPQLFWELRDRIADTLEIPKTHSSMSIWRMYKGAFIRPHYDPVYPGYVLVKANICVLSPEDNSVIVNKENRKLEERSLNAMEVSLYKHEVKPVKGERINFCYGFVVPCEVLGWDIDCTRVRRSIKQWEAAESYTVE